MKLLLLCCLLVFSMGVWATITFAQNQAGTFQEVSTDQFDGVIFPKNKVAELLKQCSRPAPKTSEYWEPTKEDILRLEQALKEYVKSKPYRQCPELFLNLSKYKRQYGGIGKHTSFEKGVNIRRKKSIYVHAFLEYKNDGSWKKAAWMLCDGGCSSWGVEFDVESGEILNLEPNGR